jgi:hypothetical protein
MGRQGKSRKRFLCRKDFLSVAFLVGRFSLTLRNISDMETVIVTELGEPGHTACRAFCCADGRKQSRVESSPGLPASHAILGDQNGTGIGRKPHAVLRAIPLLLL